MNVSQPPAPPNPASTKPSTTRTLRDRMALGVSLKQALVIEANHLRLLNPGC